MSIRNLALSISGGLVLIAIVYLSIDVHASPSTPSQQKVDEARARHKHTAQLPSAANLDDPWARPTGTTPKFGTPPAATATQTSPVTAAPPPAPTPPPTPTITAAQAATPDLENDPKLETSNAKDEANRLYDRQDYEGAIAKAEAVLKAEPGDIRMIRVVVSAACNMSDAEKAKQYFVQLPPHDQDQMEKRCQRFGITFHDQQ